jgi:hypothetical protein
MIECNPESLADRTGRRLRRQFSINRCAAIFMADLLRPEGRSIIYVAHDHAASAACFTPIERNTASC